MKPPFFETSFSSKIENIYFDSTSKVTIDIKREDQIDAFISGNKYRKLKYNIKEAITQNKSQLITYGGAYSNHICATAAAANLYGLESTGIIRGEELVKHEKTNTLNPTLNFAKGMGMRLEFIDRQAYKHRDSRLEQERLIQKYGNAYFIPEGGTNQLAVKGCEEILSKQDKKYDFIACCVGTGGTLAGLINSSWEHQVLYGFSALKGHTHQDIKSYTTKTNWIIFEDSTFGGYAKTNPNLIEFINNFYRRTSIKLDPIYTGKMIYRLYELAQQKHFPNNTKILAIHSGGLQGIEGFNALQIKKGKPPLIF